MTRGRLLLCESGQSAGWPLSFGIEESPGSTEKRRRITSGGGDPRESATESKPPPARTCSSWEVRVKGCGKSAPRGRQRQRHGKPRREQNRIGTTGRGPTTASTPLRGVVRVGCTRRPATAAPDEWPSRAARRHTEPGLQADWLSSLDFAAHGGNFGPHGASCRRADRRSVNKFLTLTML